MIPREEYRLRLTARTQRAARLDAMGGRIGAARLGMAIAAAVMLWLRPPVWWFALPVSAFLALVIVHARVIRAGECAKRAMAFYARGLDRLADSWPGRGESGGRFLDPAHPYAEDLDLFGRGSLFELLCTARTPVGEETLAAWLLAPTTESEVRARHTAVDELRPKLDLREALAISGEDIRSELNAAKMAAWSEMPPVKLPRHARAIAASLAALVLLTVLAWGAFGVSRLLPLVSLTAGAIFAYRLRSRVLSIVQDAGDPAKHIGLLADVLGLLESQSFISPRLLELRAALDTGGVPPSAEIARLNRLIDLLDSRDNLLVRLIGPPLLWTTQVTLGVEAWRIRCGPAVRRWLNAVGEIEALSAIGSHAYEHPADPFPEFAEPGGCFDAEAMAHPLLPEGRSVRNDLRLGGDLRVLVISGSNMSGKSTLLRAAGTNAVLAMAGAPVRARRLRLSPLAVGASIRVVDSLQTGSSRFQAEITRLRKIMDMTGQPSPVLFLLDELLHGTNSHDRRIGSEAVVRALIDRGAIGLVTTHDLALAEIAEALAPRALNSHFEDRLENGVMTFDYRMRPGVVRHSNALELMRSVGLPV